MNSNPDEFRSFAGSVSGFFRTRIRIQHKSAQRKKKIIWIYFNKKFRGGFLKQLLVRPVFPVITSSPSADTVAEFQKIKRSSIWIFYILIISEVSSGYKTVMHFLALAETASPSIPCIGHPRTVPVLPYWCCLISTGTSCYGPYVFKQAPLLRREISASVPPMWDVSLGSETLIILFQRDTFGKVSYQYKSD